jgi:hypothetical protein
VDGSVEFVGMTLGYGGELRRVGDCGCHGEGADVARNLRRVVCRLWDVDFVFLSRNIMGLRDEGQRQGFLLAKQAIPADDFHDVLSGP